MGRSEVNRFEEHRSEGLARQRANEHDAALAAFDLAHRQAPDESSKTLVSINKAFSLIQLGEIGAPEVKALPSIVLRRQNDEHVAQAAYWLALRFRTEGNIERARSYAAIALESSAVAGREDWRVPALNELANLEMLDSEFEAASAHYRELLAITPEENLFQRYFLLQNLGYTEIVGGNPKAGIPLLHEAIALARGEEAEGWVAESYVDLCLGYLDIGEPATAVRWGMLGLESTSEDRLLRNAHYLLGEANVHLGNYEKAEEHFDHLCSWYPEFPQLKNLLYALDLRKVINWKL